MRHLSIVFVVSVVVILASTAAVADKPPKCKSCGGEITGEYFETNGSYYHSEHFTCDHCDKPIKGEYVTHRGRKYHNKCFEGNVALRCAVCGDVIEGEYLLDFWGNAYHPKHQNDMRACEYCARLISAITQGGVRYSDDRIICNVCRESAVTSKAEATRILAEVARHMRRIGLDVETGAIDLYLVDLKKMQEISGRDSDRLTGYTDFAEAKNLLGMSTKRKIDVYVLYGMPRPEIVSTLAHELTHVWQFTAGRLKNDRSLSEGSCNFAAYLVLQNYDDKHSEFVVSNLENDKGKIYGEGFRRVKRFAEDNGLAAWIDLLENKDRLPRGY